MEGGMIEDLRPVMSIRLVDDRNILREVFVKQLVVDLCGMFVSDSDPF